MSYCNINNCNTALCLKKSLIFNASFDLVKVFLAVGIDLCCVHTVILPLKKVIFLIKQIMKDL